MADENKSPQIENPAKITLEELAYMVKQDGMGTKS